MKRIRLTELKQVTGKPFLEAELDKDGNSIIDPVLDSKGNQVLDNQTGKPMQRVRTRAIKGEEALKVMLERFFLNIPAEYFTRNDVVQGTMMMRSIQEVKDGVLILDEGVHDWLRDRFKSECKAEIPGLPQGEKPPMTTIGLRVLGANLKVIEDALDNFERAVEAKKE